MTSLCAPLEIEGHTDVDGSEVPAPAAVQLEGAGRGKKVETAPAINTTAPDKPTGLAGNACCECEQQSSCKTARCGCQVAGRNCVSCWCLVRCANVTPQTRQDTLRTTQRKTGEGSGRQRGKRRRGRGQGADATTNSGETREGEKRTTPCTGTAEETADGAKTDPTPPTTQRKGKAALARGQGRGANATTHAGATRYEGGTSHAKGTADETTDEATTTKRKGTKTQARRRGAAAETAKPDKEEDEKGDVPRYIPTPEDLPLREVYGDWVHGNPGTHLDGGVKEDGLWQGWWCDLAVMPPRRYEAPSGKVGRRYVNALADELPGIRDRRWNSERFIVFQTGTIQRARHVIASRDI